MSLKLNLRITNPNISVLALPVLAIPVLVILFLVVINSGYSVITRQLNEINNIKEKEEILEKKLGVLQDVREGVLEQTNISVITLPQKNSAWQTLSLMKKYSLDENMQLTKIGLESTRAGDEINSVSLDAELTSPEQLSSGISFLKNLMYSLPLMTISEVGISKDYDGDIDFEIEGLIYWANFPAKLPLIDEPIRQLTQDEIKILEKINAMNQLEFGILDSKSPSGRENPFI